MKMHPFAVATCATLILSACHNGAADYPALLPTQQILAEPTLPDHSASAAVDPEATQAATSARADALRRKADALNAPVIEPAIKSRMEQAASN